MPVHFCKSLNLLHPLLCRFSFSPSFSISYFFLLFLLNFGPDWTWQLGAWCGVPSLRQVPDFCGWWQEYACVGSENRTVPQDLWGAHALCDLHRIQPALSGGGHRFCGPGGQSLGVPLITVLFSKNWSSDFLFCLFLVCLVSPILVSHPFIFILLLRPFFFFSVRKKGNNFIWFTEIFSCPFLKETTRSVPSCWWRRWAKSSLSLSDVHFLPFSDEKERRIMGCVIVPLAQRAHHTFRSMLPESILRVPKANWTGSDSTHRPVSPCSAAANKEGKRNKEKERNFEKKKKKGLGVLNPIKARY